MNARRRSFDALVDRLTESPTTLSERELLQPSHWALGEDARLREDSRFRETPWGRWMLSEDFVANDAIYPYPFFTPSGSPSSSRRPLSRSFSSQLPRQTGSAPDLQLQVLKLEAVDGVEPLAERQLRAVMAAGTWPQQRAAWAAARRPQ